MGCVSSKPATLEEGSQSKEQFKGAPLKTFHKPKWRSDPSEEPWTAERLKAAREDFWFTQPHYGGDRVIWDALKAACEADTETAKLILETAGIIVTAEDMTVCYDERGAKYELPKFLLSDPINMVKE